jgi:hypothetical protein
MAYVPSSNHKVKTLQEGDEHTNCQCRNDSLEHMHAAEKEWDQLDNRLARYGQNSEQTSGWKTQFKLIRLEQFRTCLEINSD